MELFSHDKNEFEFGRHTDAYVYEGNNHVATFERISISNCKIKIDHFAVGGNFAGKKLGKRCLELFAKMVREKCPSVNSIKFDLYRKAGNPSPEDLQKLANAREQLLISVGAIKVTREDVRPGTILIKGEWLKKDWPS